jgi:hypothetical protein
MILEILLFYPQSISTSFDLKIYLSHKYRRSTPLSPIHFENINKFFEEKNNLYKTFKRWKIGNPFEML